ncbi:MAG: tetraacyldisaccharide 4'-kinase [Acidobacteriota bacterium]
MNLAERLWSRVLETRARRYAAGTLPSERLDRPVVSVGNLTVGGTGKTPVVEHLARWLAAAGLRPAVLSRGYGRRSRETVVVSSGDGPLVAPDRGGDEPVLLARRLPGVIVAVAPRRRDAARAALAHAPDVFILDDGFQHLSVRRDVDLLLLDAVEPFGGLRYPPFGRLREPLSAMGRADAFVFTRPHPGFPDEAALAAVALENPEAPAFAAEIRAAGLEAASGAAAGLAADARCVAVAGVARPATFAAALARIGIAPAETLLFPDHHRYTPSDAARIAEAARRSESAAVVTTGKDAVKLEPLLSLPVRTIRLEVELPAALLDFVHRGLFPETPAAGRGGVS